MLDTLMQRLRGLILTEDDKTPEPCPFCGAKVKEKETYWEIPHKGGCYLAERIGCYRTLLDKKFTSKIKQWNERPTEKAAYIIGRREQAARGKQRVD